ncbi:MAG: GNAT family N-acetyltransferase [Ignavibacteria bacterium]|nr:GNAT family N-acetyltransferase [Ignavibacteria bacterium]
MVDSKIIVRIATADDQQYADTITEEMEVSANVRGTGIAKRSTDYIRQKMKEGKAVIAITKGGVWVGFCYIEAWQDEKYVANSGLIVSPDFRGSGVAKEIKRKIFELSRKKYPDALIFGLTTGLAVMKINSSLGYKPVTYSQLTTDEKFWMGCQSCVNFPILTLKERHNCLCTAMLYNPSDEEESKPEQTSVTASTEVSRTNWSPTRPKQDRKSYSILLTRWLRFKQFIILKTRWMRVF